MIGYSVEEQWLPIEALKSSEKEDLLFTNNDPDLQNTEGIWVVLDPEKAPRYLTITIGSATEEYLFNIDLTGATPVLRDEDGRILYIRKKGGEKDELHQNTCISSVSDKHAGTWSNSFVGSRDKA